MKQLKRRVLSVFMLIAMLLTTVLSTGSIGMVKADAATGALTELKAGDKVVIFNQANGSTISDKVSSYNLGGVAGTVENGVLTTQNTPTVFTVVKDADGLVTFINDVSKNTAISVYTSGTHTNLVTRGQSDTDTDCSKWALESVDGTSFKLKNNKSIYTDKSGNKSSRYISFNNGIFKAFNFDSKSDVKNYAFTFYSADKVQVAAPLPEYAGGTNLAIYNTYTSGTDVKESVASSTVSDAGKIKAAEAALKDGKISSYGDFGKYDITKVNGKDSIFTIKDTTTNKFLSYTAVEKKDAAGKVTGYDNKLSFVDATDANSEWEIKAVDDKGNYKIRSTTAVYQEGKAADQYLESYNGEYCLYGFKGNSQFYFNFVDAGLVTKTEKPADPTPAPTPSTVELKDGSKVAIVNAASKVMLSNAASRFNLKADKVEIADNKLTTAVPVLYTVKKCADGTYEFSNNGKYLTAFSDGTHTNIKLVDTETDKTDDCTKWNVTKVDGKDSYYLSNARLTGYYLEYYSKNTEFSPYKGTPGAAYEITFFDEANVITPAKPAEPTTPTDTDKPEVPIRDTKTKDSNVNTYFGQIHSHTNFSDGAGTPEEAFKHASKDVANLDFLAVTDHSNSLDNEASSDITKNVDTSADQEWTKGHALAKQYSTSDFTCLYGYEMTWSNGLGHMNTFDTPGFQSRTQDNYKTYATALNNYYNSLAKVPDSISQFNHPGTTFGDFQDFAYYTQERDNLITMIEVGNGEGTVGSSGYFPSYEYYQRALDKGWHVAPTNNQDNHKGKWGDANTARTVMVSKSNTEDSIYDSMRNYRIYATEDNNLSIKYTLNDYLMGSILTHDEVGNTANIKAVINDPDAADVIGNVQVIVNGGIVAAHKEIDTNSATVEFSVPNNYSFYYLKVTEKDGNIAVTAPVWSGKVEACGINKTYTNTTLPVAGKAADVNVDFYNNESQPLTINNINFSIQGKTVGTINADQLAAAGIKEIAAKSTGSYAWSYTPDKAGKVKIDVKVNATFNGVDKVYTDVLYVTYTDQRLVSKVVVDGSHYNDYVTGYYADSMNNFTSIAGNKNIEVTIADKITEDTLKDCSFLVISAPAKKSGATKGDGGKQVNYAPSHFSDDFLTLVKNYVAKGGSVIVCGLADYQDTTDSQTATELNKLLGAIGSTMKINSDEVWDDVNNGGQQYRLYPTTFNMNSEFLKGVLPEKGQKYSQYSGCSVDITNAKANDVVNDATWLVNGFDTTLSKDCKDANGNKISDQPVMVQKGNVTFLAEQDTKAGGHIFAAGGVFMSDFEVKAEMDNNDSLPYANKNIIENILSKFEKEVPTSTIAEARKGQPGDIFAVEGYVTSGTTNTDTTFFDTIYLQDDTAGIDIFPYADAGMKVGTHLRVVGTWDQYQGDTELRVISVKKIDDKTKVYAPKEVSTKDAMDYAANGGSYLKTTGKVTRVKLSDSGELEEFWLTDASGVEAAIFIDGYIKSGTTSKNTLADIVKVGERFTAAGILYMHPEGNSDVSVPVFRVKDCDEIVKAASDPVVVQAPTNGTVSKSVFMAAYLNGQDVNITSSDGKVTFKFKSSKLSKELIDKMSDFNANVVLGGKIADISKRLKGLPANVKTFTVHFGYDGDLPGEAEVTLDVSTSGFKNGQKLYLYYYNPATNAFQLIDTDTMTAGMVTFTMTHCSDYVITDSELPSNYTKTAPKTGTQPDNTGVWVVILIISLLFVAGHEGKKVYIKRKADRQ